MQPNMHLRDACFRSWTNPHFKSGALRPKGTTAAAAAAATDSAATTLTRRRAQVNDMRFNRRRPSVYEVEGADQGDIDDAALAADDSSSSSSSSSRKGSSSSSSGGGGGGGGGDQGDDSSSGGDNSGWLEEGSSSGGRTVDFGAAELSPWNSGPSNRFSQIDPMQDDDALHTDFTNPLYDEENASP